MKANLLFIYFYFLIVLNCSAQFKNNIWCFGDSAGIKFINGSTQVITSSTMTRGGSCVISDSLGNLLFYANTDYYPMWIQGFGGLGVVFDRFHNLMHNGDTLVGEAWYQEQIIIPFPDSSNLFYLFTGGLFTPMGFYFSMIDLSQNSGLGSVVQKNIQLANFQASDCVSAIKHGNGRDWWIVFKRWDISNNNYYTFLVTPLGISGPFLQSIGTITDNGFMHSSFSKDGSRYLIVDYRGLVEVLDFDRCSGLFGNAITIEMELPVGPWPSLFGCEFSPSGRFIYISSNNDIDSYIYQYDLQATNISNSKDTIASLTLPTTGGLLKRGPDDKIYFTCVYNDGSGLYPYPDTTSNQYNEYLSVINFPDSAGSTCDFSPFSFYLGGNETYWGLPNNPDYELGPIVGSICDTLTSLQTAVSFIAHPTIQISWTSNWQKAFVNASNLKGHKWRLEVFDLFGNRIYFDNGTLMPPYFSRGIELPGIASGMYVVRLETEREVLTGKFIVE